MALIWQENFGKENPGIVIIFLTNFIQYAPEGFEVQAFRYLLKSDMQERLVSYFEDAVREVVREKQIITISVNSELIDIPVSHILYLESNLRVVTMHLIDDDREEYRFYGNMTDLVRKAGGSWIPASPKVLFGKHGVHRTAPIRKSELVRWNRSAFQC